MLRSIANVWAWTATILLIAFGFVWMCVVFVLTAPFDKARYLTGRAFRFLGVLQVKLNPLWHFSTRGVRITDPRRPYVVVSNHESYADISLISHLPWEMKWLAKVELLRIPVFGWMMRMAGDIPVHRGRATSRRDALEACRERLARRVSVMIFPEGTRSADGAMLPFRDGAFRLAIETGTPLLPLAVAGTSHGMAKGSFRFRPTRALCEVLEPIETRHLTLEDVPALKEMARVRIARARARLRAELGLSDAHDDLDGDGVAGLDAQEVPRSATGNTPLDVSVSRG